MSTNMNRRTFVQGGLAASVLATLAGCGKKQDAAQSTSGGAGTAASGAFRYYISSPDCIDPYNVNEDQGTQVTYNLFDSLTDFDYEAGKIIGKAAESWEPSDGGKKFTFHLVKGAKFHNGDPVNSEAFKRAWTRVVSPTYGKENAGVLDYHLGMVKGYDDVLAGKTEDFVGLTCPDESTFVVELSMAYPDFPYVAAHPCLGPVPKAAVDDPKAFYKAPIGNGPFMMDGEWVDGQYINVKRFDDYYGTPASIGAIQFNIQKDVETAYREFQAGNYDKSEVPAPQTNEAISQYGQSTDGFTGTPGHQFLTGEEASVYYLNMTVTDETLKDPDVRRAISLAINRQAICDNLFQGLRKPADDILPPSIPGYEKGAWQYSHYDKEAAIKLLDAKYPADSSNKRKLSIQLSYNPEGGHKEIMEMVQSDLEAVGFTVTSDTREWSAILDDYRKGNTQAGRLGWTADYPIADNFLYSLFKSDSGDNCSKYNNAEVDKALEAARSTLDDKERVAAMTAVSKMVGDDCPIAPIMYYSHREITSDKVASFNFDAGRHPHLDTAKMA